MRLPTQWRRKSDSKVFNFITGARAEWERDTFIIVFEGVGDGPERIAVNSLSMHLAYEPVLEVSDEAEDLDFEIPPGEE